MPTKIKQKVEGKENEKNEGSGKEKERN